MMVFNTFSLLFSPKNLFQYLEDYLIMKQALGKKVHVKSALLVCAWCEGNLDLVFAHPCWSYHNS
jgi:hypothetical protein